MAAHLGLKRWHLKGRPSSYRFITFDLDSKVKGPAQVAADRALLTDALRSVGIEPVPAASGSPGGIHLWTGCASYVRPETVYRINAAAQMLCPSLDGAPLSNAKDGLVRPPGAAHRNGGYSRLLDHTPAEMVRLLGPDSPPVHAFEGLAARLESLAAARPVEPVDVEPVDVEPVDVEPVDVEPVDVEPVESVTGQGGKRVPPSIAARGARVRPVTTCAAGRPRIDVPRRPLGDRALRGLRRRLGLGDDHSAAKHAPARSMALAGWTEAEALGVVLDEQTSPAMEWLRSERQADGTRRRRTKEETAALWSRVWWLAVEDAARMPRRPEDSGRILGSGAVGDLYRRMAAAGPARWARQSGPADAAVLYAVAYVMEESGSTDVSANVRRIGVLAGYTAQTASQALWRLERDGWITFTAEAERRAGKARRVALATGHECPTHRHHRCAVYAVDAGHTGSDRRGTPPRPAPPALSPDQLREMIAHQQADVWDSLGHHTARTLWAARTLQSPNVAELAAVTGYSHWTTRRHLDQLGALNLVTPSGSREIRTEVTLHQAGQETGTLGRIAGMAATARVAQAVHVWWCAEVEYRSLPYKARPPRPSCDQAVITGMDPSGREYPRDEAGRPDHARAHGIEAERIQADRLFAHAHQLTRAGDVVDPVRLDASVADPAHPSRGRRAALAGRHICPRCSAAPGERCTTPRGRHAARYHRARRDEAHAALKSAQVASR
ncbi:hypothetical protein [Streptomyces sp. NPDC001108]